MAPAGRACGKADGGAVAVAVPNQVESIVADELHAAIASLKAQVKDPAEIAAIEQMAISASLLPIRIARGEDVGDLVRQLEAEAQNRPQFANLRAKHTVEQAWLNAVGRIICSIFLPGLPG